MNQNEVAHEEDYRGKHIVIAYDQDGIDSPRDWDNLGTMYCWHNHYTLGDEQPRCDKRETIIALIDNELPKSFFIPAKYDGYALEYLEDMQDDVLFKLFTKYYVYLPINAYIHSGITISSSRYNDPFDSGNLGFIAVSKTKAMKEFSKKGWSDKLQEQVTRILDGEIETYDDFLNGNVYGYGIFDIQEDEDYDWCDSLDSCWGYYPEHSNERGSHDYDYCLKEARSLVDWQVKRDHDLDMQRATQLGIGE